MAGVGVAQQFSGHVSVTGNGGGMSRRARRRLACRLLLRRSGLRGRSGLMVGCSWLELWLLSQCGGVFYYKAYLYISRRSI